MYYLLFSKQDPKENNIIWKQKLNNPDPLIFLSESSSLD